MRELPFSSPPLVTWPAIFCYIAERSRLSLRLALIGTVVFAVVFAWVLS